MFWLCFTNTGLVIKAKGWYSISSPVLAKGYHSSTLEIPITIHSSSSRVPLYYLCESSAIRWGDLAANSWVPTTMKAASYALALGGGVKEHIAGSALTVQVWFRRGPSSWPEWQSCGCKVYEKLLTVHFWHWWQCECARYVPLVLLQGQIGRFPAAESGRLISVLQWYHPGLDCNTHTYTFTLTHPSIMSSNSLVKIQLWIGTWWRLWMLW